MKYKYTTLPTLDTTGRATKRPFVESKNVDVLLGQNGFFDSFRVRFEKDHNTFELIPIKKK